MSKETRSLLKYDLLSMLRDFWLYIPVIAVLLLWCYLFYGIVGDVVILISFLIGMQLLAGNIKDWQSQIRMYVSAGMTRKGIFQVLLIRNGMLIFIGILAEAFTAAVVYPGIYGIKPLAVMGFLLLFIWGLGQVSGPLVYQKKKLGFVLMMLGYMLVSVLSMNSFFIRDQRNFLVGILDEMTAPNLLAAGLGAAAVLAGGICYAKKQIGKYMVY